jgi:hypothetical protein
MKTIQIKSISGKVLFTYKCVDNTIAKTVEEAVKNSTDLNSADLSYANLSYANLRYANLSYANLSYANLNSADLSYANLSYANLRYANLSYADLSYANLSYANLISTNLISANLRYANLSYADLSYANLNYANLSYAKTDKRYIQIGCIGSSKRLTTYCFEDDKIMCGCFKGTLKEFEKECKKTHKNNKQYLNEYIGAIKYIKSIAKDTPSKGDKNK